MKRTREARQSWAVSEGFMSLSCGSRLRPGQESRLPTAGSRCSAARSGFAALPYLMKYPDTRHTPSCSSIGVTVSTADALFSYTASN